MYQPGVMPDTQGLAPGISAAAGTISGAFKTWADWKRQDAVRKDEQAFTSQRDEARMQQEMMLADRRLQNESAMLDKRLTGESSMLEKRLQGQMSMFGAQRDANREDKALERAIVEEQLRLANVGKAAFLVQAGYDPGAVEAASKMDPKAAGQFLDSAMSQAGYRLKAQTESQAQLDLEEGRRKAQPPSDPKMTMVPQADGTMSPYGVIVDRGKVISGALPVGERSGGLTPEQAMALGLKPTEAVVGGVKYRTPSAGGNRPQMGMDGKYYRFDAPTGTMVEVPMQGQTPVAVPADAAGNAIRAMLQNRPK